MITSLNVGHYKSIQQASLTFRNLSIIVGPNGVGKSNIVDAMHFLHDCAKDDIDTAVIKRHGIDSIRQWSKTRPYNITLEVGMESARGNGNYRVVISSAKGNYRILEEAGSWNGPDPRQRPREDSERLTSMFKRDENGAIETSSPFGDFIGDREMRVDQDTLFLTNIATRSIFGVSTVFMPIAQELLSFSLYNIYPNTLRNPSIVSKDTVLSESGSNLASILKLIKSNKRMGQYKDDILSSLQQMMPNASDILVRSAGGYYVPVIRVVEQSGDAHDFNLSQISDGTLRTLGLLAAFYQPGAPSKIAMEEPEQMIHPGGLSIIYEAVQSFLDNNRNSYRQVFITTHSPTLLDIVNPKDIVWAKLNKGVTECGHIRKRQLDIIKDHLFSAGELLLAEGIIP